jgi:hypothetical protein
VQSIGRECEKVTAARGVNPFSMKPESLFRETLPRAPESPQEIPLDGYLGPRQPSLTWGPRSTSHTLGVSDFGCGKSEPPHASVVCLLGAAAEDKR